MTNSTDDSEPRSDFELDGLHAWMRVAGSLTRRYVGDGVKVDIYGQADASYLVIEKKVSTSPPRSVDQYVVDTLEFANPLMKLVELLRAFDFSLSKLLSRLGQMEYDHDGSARLESIPVFHSFHQETLADEKGPSSVKSEKVKTASKQNKQIVVTKRKLDPTISAKARSFKEVARSLSPAADKKPPSSPSNVEEFEEWE